MSNSGYDFLANKNKHQRDDLIRFETDGHRYYLLNSETGEWDLCTSANGFVSSTGIGAEIFPFNAQAVARMIFRGKNFSSSVYKDLKSPSEIMACWEERSRRGTAFHLGCPETYYNQLAFDHNDPDITDLIPKFMAFANDHVHLEPYRTEWLVFDREIRVSGSIDMIFKEPDSTFSIYDWKLVDHILPTDGSVSKKYKRILKKDADKRRTVDDLHRKSKLVKYSLQLGVYKYMLERCYDIKIKDVFLIRFHSDLEAYEKIACFDMSNEIEQIMADRLELLKDWPIRSAQDIACSKNVERDPNDTECSGGKDSIDELSINISDIIV